MLIDDAIEVLKRAIKAKDCNCLSDYRQSSYICSCRRPSQEQLWQAIQQVIEDYDDDGMAHK